MPSLSSTVALSGQADLVALTRALSSSWTADYIAARLGGLPLVWQGMFPSFRVKGVPTPVCGVQKVQGASATVPYLVLLLPPGVSNRPPLTVPELVTVLSSLPAPYATAPVYTFDDTVYGAINYLRLFVNVLDGSPYVLEVSSDPLQVPPTAA